MWKKLSSREGSLEVMIDVDVVMLVMTGVEK